MKPYAKLKWKEESKDASIFLGSENNILEIKKIDKRKIRKSKNCVWNVYWQFGIDLDKFEDDPDNPLYKNCKWSEDIEGEITKLFKVKKVECGRLVSQRKYDCNNCEAIFFFPTIDGYNPRRKDENTAFKGKGSSRSS